jgi:hypothetical protein
MNGNCSTLRKLIGVAQEVQKRLAQPHRVGMQRADRAVAMDCDLVPVLRRQRFDRLDNALDQWRKSEGFEIKLHPPGLDLGQVKDIVDQGEQVPGCTEHAIEGLDVLLQRLDILPQHLADADDGIERRAQLMAHIGEELRFVLTCIGELAAFFLNFVEQAHVLNRDSGLVGKGHYQLNLPVAEWPYRVSCQSDNAYWRSFPQQWDAKKGTKATDCRRPVGVFGIG